MSLHYVTRKLKTQSLTEEATSSEVKNDDLVEADAPRDGAQNDTNKHSTIEDSGTESDDEMDEDFRARKADRLRRKTPPLTRSTPPRTTPPRTPTATPTFPEGGIHLRDSGALCEDNYSSEEELKEINDICRSEEQGKKGQYAGVAPKGGGAVGVAARATSKSRGPSSGSSTAEKRKWSAVAIDESYNNQVHAHIRAGSNGGSSGDEEVTGLLHLHPSPSCSSTSSGRGLSLCGDTPTPVQFCASPPLDVCRPSGWTSMGVANGSHSPPPKLFHLSPNPSSKDLATATEERGVAKSRASGRGLLSFAQSASLDQTGGIGGRNAAGGGSGASRLNPQQTRRPSSASELLSAAANDDAATSASDRRRQFETPSPNKRHRSRTPRPQNLQRPCLDFEKMQQIKKRVVTSWRPQGSELSLFCW